MPQNTAKSSLLSKKLINELGIGQDNGIANNLLDNLSNYDFKQSSVSHYEPLVQKEVLMGVKDLRNLIDKENNRTKITLPFGGTKDKAMNAEDPIVRDQAVWSLPKHQSFDILTKSIEKAPTERLAVSALLALQKMSVGNTSRTLDFLAELSKDKALSNINLAEWATLLRNEMMFCKTGESEYMSTPVSQRKAVHLANKVFDLTVPLIFQCIARTTIGGISHNITISPAMFMKVFGDAMACINHETFESKLVLEKEVMGLHADGSAHYEHFPFTGTTDKVGQNLFLHNYWSQIHRPFYTSGRVEQVSDKYPVIQNVPMTFSRMAVTSAYDKYAVNGVALPESVRGTFFGYGHISPKVLLSRGLKLQAGDFQISSRDNPETGKLANTKFYGTFFGKISETNNQGDLVMNGKSTHCDKDGRLDYTGKGLMDSDPVRPDDWH